MKFKEYLIGKRNIIIILMCINSCALIVNILGLQGEFKDGRCDKIEHKFFTDWDISEPNDYVLRGHNESYNNNFWPFVKFFKTSERAWYCDGDWETRHIESFRGIFRYYDYSEFFIYSIIILLVLYISWEFKRKI